MAIAYGFILAVALIGLETWPALKASLWRLQAPPTDASRDAILRRLPDAHPPDA